MESAFLRILLLAICLIVRAAARDYPAAPGVNHDLLEAIAIHNSTKYSSMVPFESVALLRAAAAKYPRSNIRRIAREDDDESSSAADGIIESTHP